MDDQSTFGTEDGNIVIEIRIFFFYQITNKCVTFYKSIKRKCNRQYVII